MFVSEYFRLNEAQLSKMKSLGVFDALIDVDINFFINAIRLKDATILEFKEAYQDINKFFSDIATLLEVANFINISLAHGLLKYSKLVSHKCFFCFCNISIITDTLLEKLCQ